MTVKSLISKSALAAAMLLAPAAMSAEETMTFAYASRSAEPAPIGTMRTDAYDVAIALTNPSVYGMKVTSIDVPVLPSANVSALSAWISTELRLEQKGSVKVNVPDVSYDLTMPTEGDGVKWVTVTLDEPYTIPEGGIYVGYSLTVDKIDESDATRYPVVATTGVEPGSLYLHTSRTYRNWDDRSADLQAVSMLQVTLEGGTIPANAARLGAIPYKYIAAGTPNDIDVMVYNIGTSPISTLSYTVTIAGNTAEQTLTLDKPIEATFGYGEYVSFNIPAIDGREEHDISLRLTAVNGEPMESAPVNGKVYVALFVPRHLALVEEYTGMWCGNCPRGFVAMERMNELYPDFIGIAYHNGDALTMETGDPGIADGYPSCTVDRALQCDPYNADPSSSTFSLPQVWQKYCDEFAPVEVEVEAVWDAESRTVTATSTVDWAVVPPDAESGKYRMEYVLIADGLTDPYWYQINYYHDGRMGYPEYMDEFTHGPEYVFGLTFNDVAMMTSGFKGVKGSIPSIALGEKTSHTFTFDTAEAYTSAGKPFPFDSDKLRVAAFVLRGDGAGIVVNAAKCNVRDSSGIPAVATDSPVTETAYYDLQGRRIAEPLSGICIRVERHADGTLTTTKIKK